MPSPWNDDPPGFEAQIEANIVALVGRFPADAQVRPVPTIAMAQDWHRAVYVSVPLPEAYYAGEIRDSDPRFPELYGYQVSVGWGSGMPSKDVPDALERLEAQIQAACSTLDAVIPVGVALPDETALAAVLTTCGNVHGEWVRIHPFANGNGRTARLWAAWLALRYGLPLFIQIKPRPAGQPYAAAAAASMAGDHRLCVVVFAEMLRAKLTRP